MAVRTERWGPAPHGRTNPCRGSGVHSPVIRVRGPESHCSHKPGTQPAAGHLVHATSLATPTRTARVEAVKEGKATAAQPWPHLVLPGTSQALCTSSPGKVHQQRALGMGMTGGKAGPSFTTLVTCPWQAADHMA